MSTAIRAVTKSLAGSSECIDRKTRTLERIYDEKTVILGAGYSGLLWLCDWRAQQPRRIDRLAAAGIDFVLGRVTSIDLAHSLVCIEKEGAETVLHFDRLVHALGSYTDTDAVAGIRDHAMCSRAAMSSTCARRCRPWPRTMDICWCAAAA